MRKPHWVPNDILGTLKLQFHVVSRPLPPDISGSTKLGSGLRVALVCTPLILVLYTKVTFPEILCFPQKVYMVDTASEVKHLK